MPYLRWDDHSAHVMSLVSKLYKNLELTDCTLDTNGGLVYGHKAIIVACSPYLKKLIVDHHETTIIPLKEVKVRDMKCILDFVYFGEVDISVADLSSLIETAQLLQIPSLSEFSVAFSEKSCSNRLCDGNMLDRGTKCTMNVTKYDDSDVYKEDTKGFCYQNIHHENVYRMTANIESTYDSKTHTGNELKDLSQSQSQVLSEDNASKNSATRIDMVNEGTENIQDYLTPFSFVAVSPCSVESEPIEDELNAACDALYEVENPLETKSVNADSTKEVEWERELKSESVVKDEIKEVDNDHEDSDDFEHMVTDYISHRVDDMNMLKGSENICGIKSTQNVMLIEAVGCNSSKDCSREGVKDLPVEFEAVSDVPKCELSEVKPFETGSDNEAMDDNNDLLSPIEIPEPLNCKEDTIALINFQKDVNEASELSKTKRVKIKELSVDLESINSCSNVHVNISHSAIEESCDSMCTGMQPINKQIELKKSFVQDLDCLQSVSESAEMDNQHTDTLVLNRSVLNAENVDSSPSDEVIQSHNIVGFKRLPCNVFENSFMESKMLKKHALIHTREKLFVCDLCNSSFRTKDTLRKHIHTHTGRKPYKCEICRASFSRSSHLKTHTRTHTGQKPYKCDVCQTSFTRRSTLINHTRTHTGEKPYKCVICGASFSKSANLKTHTLTHTGQKPYKCDVCQASFTLSSTLKIHKRTHTGEKPYKCNICGVSFSHRSALKTHTGMHTGEKNYKCDVCEASFLRSDHLQNHTRTHTGEKPYKCDVCQASFSQSVHLKTHHRTHTGIRIVKKPYKCDVCEASFSRRFYLQNHSRTHTGEKPYKCDVCQASFSQSVNLKTHTRKHTGEQPYKFVESHIHKVPS